MPAQAESHTLSQVIIVPIFDDSPMPGRTWLLTPSPSPSPSGNFTPAVILNSGDVLSEQIAAGLVSVTNDHQTETKLVSLLLSPRGGCSWQS